MANRKWTEDDCAELRRSIINGETVKEIAARMARSQEATRTRMQSLGLTKPRSKKQHSESQVIGREA